MAHITKLCVPERAACILLTAERAVVFAAVDGPEQVGRVVEAKECGKGGMACKHRQISDFSQSQQTLAPSKPHALLHSMKFAFNAATEQHGEACMTRKLPVITQVSDKQKKGMPVECCK